jgi:NDP-sugar pyrophosphorylase family protein
VSPALFAAHADVFTDAPLPDMITPFKGGSAVASSLAVPPQSSHQVANTGADRLINRTTPRQGLRQRENGGYFVLRQEIACDLSENEYLFKNALKRQFPQGQLLACPDEAYRTSADTVKECAQSEERYHRRDRPWMAWDPKIWRSERRCAYVRPYSIERESHEYRHRPGNIC